MNLKRCLQELRRCALSLLFIIVGIVLATQNAPAAESAATLNSCNLIRNSLTILTTCPGPKAFRQVKQQTPYHGPMRKTLSTGIGYASSTGIRALQPHR